MTPIRVLLADDHTLVRAGIRGLVQSIPGASVVAETGNGDDALALIRSEHPDVALVDITMPGLNGLELVGQVTREGLATKVIVLSMHGREGYVAAALQAGACGYLQKSAAVAELPAALECVQRGEVYLSAGISKNVVDSLRGAGGENPLAALSPRQREILRLVAEGLSNKEIGFRLEISSKTVDTHRAQIMQRLGIHTVQGLVKFAIRSGLVPEDD